MTSKTKAFVTSCDKGFAVGAAALLKTAARFHPDIPRYCFVPPKQFKDLQETLGALAEVRAIPRDIRGVPEDRQASIGRLFAASLSEEIAVYVDADAIFCKPAPELWEVKGNLVNAVRDTGGKVADLVWCDEKPRYVKSFPEVAAMKGFNSGMLGFATDEWRDLPERFEKALAKGGFETYKFVRDQSMLNAIIQPRVNWLPLKFNAHCLFDNGIPRDVRIVHFTSALKPWMPKFSRYEPAHYYWLKYGCETPASVLLASLIRIAARSPVRLMKRYFRKMKSGQTTPA